MKSTNPDNVLRTLAALHSALYAQDHGGLARQPLLRMPFVTISRQAGAGGRSFAQALAQRLNEIDPGDLSWTVWDNELVERVAAEHRLPAEAVAGVEDRRPNWLETVLGGLTAGLTSDRPDQLKVYHGVAATIRTLAEMGRVVIVGRGAIRITRDMPGGTHLRLVAPLAHRVSATAASRNISHQAAADWVRDVDRNREAFYRRFWPDHPLAIEEFSAVFNTWANVGEQIVASAVALIGIKPPSCCSLKVAGGG